jgi:hypothetical protein
VKNPWVAAILSFFFFGGGYIYNGKRVGLGVALVVGWALIRFGEIAIYLSNEQRTNWLILQIGLFIFMFAFASDAYAEAKAISSPRGIHASAAR